jgi:MFS family permease
LQTIISTALPTIAAQFGASESGFSWIASSYLLANAACIPLWGKISDIWGRKSIIVLANVVFLVGSLICALAHNMTTIIAGRAVQGVGGGGILILANISVSDLFSLRYDDFFVWGWNEANFYTEIVRCTMVFSVQPGPSQALLALL